jgi:uncharacterized protein YpiB (UPF0302 family)
MLGAVVKENTTVIDAMRLVSDIKNNMDESNHNDLWLEVAKENHEQACAEYNWGLAAAIEKDVAGAGFFGEARQLATARQHAYLNDELLGETDESDALREQEAFS